MNVAVPAFIFARVLFHMQYAHLEYIIFSSLSIFDVYCSEQCQIHLVNAVWPNLRFTRYGLAKHLAHEIYICWKHFRPWYIMLGQEVTFVCTFYLRPSRSALNILPTWFDIQIHLKLTWQGKCCCLGCRTQIFVTYFTEIKTRLITYYHSYLRCINPSCVSFVCLATAEDNSLFQWPPKFSAVIENRFFN